MLLVRSAGAGMLSARTGGPSVWIGRRFAFDERMSGGLGRFVIRGQRRDRGRRRGGIVRIGNSVRGSLHLANERLRGILHVANQLPRATSNLRQLIGTEQQESDSSGDGHIGNREHAEGFFPKLLNGTRPGNSTKASVDRLY